METNKTDAKTNTNTEFEILTLLEEKPSHARKLARELKLSHTFINKLLLSLYNRGYLKREKIGKSMVYSIKKSFMAEQLLIMSKKACLLKLIEKDKDFKIIIGEVMEKIKNLIKKIDCIILFGSYATFSYTKKSDIDLFFITSLTKNKLIKVIKIVEKKYGKEINIKVSNLRHFIKHLKEPLYQEVVMRGIPLYNADFFYYLKWKE